MATEDKFNSTALVIFKGGLTARILFPIHLTPVARAGFFQKTGQLTVL
jgi:hypothetical protein